MKKTGLRIEMRGFWLLFVVCLLASSAQSAELRDYHITVDPDDLEEILANPFEDIYIDCVFEYEGFIWDDARVRLRGESSREYPKKSYKINFDADNRFGARDKINLISCWTDPSFAREHLAYDFYARAGLPASRTWFARFFVNDVYFGLFLDIEQVDEHFLSYTDLPDNGTLYKADDAGAVLNGENIASLWEQDTNTELGFEPLAELREWVKNCPAQRFEYLLEQKFDVEQLARTIAVNALIANQSTYYHNYFMMEDSYGDGKWTYLPWDMDRTFYYWTGYTGPKYSRSGHQADWKTNLLISKCWSSRGMRAKIEEQIAELSDALIGNGYYETYVAELHDLLYDAVDSDTAKQFSIEDFESELEYIVQAFPARSEAILDQMAEAPTPFLTNRAIHNSEGTLLSWERSLSRDGQAVSYELWLSDDIWFSSGNETVMELDEPYYLLTNPSETDRYFRVYARTPDGNVTYSISFYEIVDNGTDELEGVFELGTISGDRILTPANGTILMPVGVMVETGASLTIEPGTRIKLGAEQSIDVSGNLSIAGTQMDSVIIEPLYDNRHWSSIFIQNGATAVDISFASLRGGGVFHGNQLIGSHVFANDRDLNITDCTFRDACTGAGGITIVNGSLYIDRIDVELPLVSFQGEQSAPDAVLTFDASQTILNSRIAKTPGAIYGGDLVDCERALTSVIRNCVFENPGDDAIDFDFAEQAEISQNRFYGCQDNAFSLGFISGFEIYNNIIMNCTNGIFAKDGSSMRVYNNIFAYCGSGLRLNNDIPPNEVVLRNCAFQGNTVDIDPDEHGTVDAQYCAFNTASSYPGAGNLFGDLDFVDAENGDFLLMSTSPLIDAGWGTDYPELDIRDSSRVDVADVANTGAGDISYVDIGAYEYQSSDYIPHPPIPETYLFLDNYPNPFNSSTRFRFGIVQSGNAELVVYDRLGRRVFGTVWHNLDVGEHTAFWDARTSSGASLASGIYFARLKQSAGTSMAKLVLIR